jgi:hypothetical protein
MTKKLSYQVERILQVREFRRKAPNVALEIDSDGDLLIEEIDSDSDRRFYLAADDLPKVRDWLNKVLP